MERKYSVAVENIKAYDNELASSKNRVAAYKLTVEQLSYFQDSILREMDNIRKELKVKDKEK
jgi:antitoxin component YwqK of YwqJK toxin-antitoxin module